MTHLSKHESHVEKTSIGADVVLADLASLVVQNFDHLQEDDGCTVVDTGSDAGVPSRGHKSDVDEQV